MANTTLYKKIKEQFPGDCKNIEFEIVKNCYGALVKPKLASGVKIDGSVLLKSIASSGTIFVRLYADDLDDDDDDDDALLMQSVFDSSKDATLTDQSDDQKLSPSIQPSTSIPDSRVQDHPLTVIDSDAHLSASSATVTAGSNRSQAQVISTNTPPVVSSASSLNTSTAQHLNTAPVHLSTASSPSTATCTITRAAAASIKEEFYKCPFDIQSIIDDAKNVNDPVEVLRYLQLRIVKGRGLELYSSEEPCRDGETNHISVDRERIIETTFGEFEYIEDYRLTFEVDFMGEDSEDFGGPRKEWLRLVLQAIKKKYFDHGLKAFLAGDYFYVGVIIALSMLQNGPLPVFLSEEILENIVSSPQSSDACIAELQRGLQALGMLSSLQQLPFLAHLLRPNSQHKLNVPRLLQILKPSFSELGSNSLKQEKEVYHLFVKYVREVAGGRRSCGQKVLELNNILEFVTGASQEPVLGFELLPSLQFTPPHETVVKRSDEQHLDEQRSDEQRSDEQHSDEQHSDEPCSNDEQNSDERHSEEEGVSSVIIVPGFIPVAHTCSNILNLPRGTNQFPLPSQDKLFALYDMAFSQPFFGCK